MSKRDGEAGGAVAAGAAAGRRGRRKAPIAVAPEARLLGEVIAWECTGVRVSVVDLKAAVEQSGLDPAIVTNMIPRNAFARAAHKLSANRIIRLLAETDDTLDFQFTREERRPEGDREFLHYERETVLTLNKATGEITCENAELVEMANDAVADAMGYRGAMDISSILQRLFGKNADLFPLRYQGGCYFVPVRFEEFLGRIEGFLGRIGGSLMRFPVPEGIERGTASVRETVAGGLDHLIAEHLKAIEDFGKDTMAGTFERAAERIKLTQHKVASYAEYLGTAKERLDVAIEAAKDRLRARIGEIAREKEAEAPVAPAPAAPADEPVAEAAPTA